jgi:hypothetical protein
VTGDFGASEGDGLEDAAGRTRHQWLYKKIVLKGGGGTAEGVVDHAGDIRWEDGQFAGERQP